MATKKIEFVASPTGKFLLAYNAGETATLDEKQADELIEAGYAKEVKKKTTDSAADKAAADKAAADKAAADKAAADKAAADKAAADKAAADKAAADKAAN
nr:hypothetical protein [Flavobacterium sp. SLB02]